jgi:hypothetical protein
MKIRIIWEQPSEKEAAQRISKTIESILEGKQEHLGIHKLNVNQRPSDSIVIDLEMQQKTS